ncbi:SRPBCC domain-containing protein [Saccharibacillus kuerlensis]|uniref:Activator of Hsp90 ATPase homologue 1/2-like C-terminal domain-containing protein n=1 Tax=Saccharibacillus kuerlensis TaxID=459527 RepID=A0ABQ2LBG6_9BACL|nr:SRPBCC domain-containing protein [Saccharibacillus kuerlensis]GGO08295.1 hypothetical protein GCM10010969_37620 [Saccharibacillus kuerlensis]
MKKTSLSFALRIVSLLVGIVGILLVLRSAELGLAQADSIAKNREGYGSGTRYWLVQQSGIAAYRILGAILAGVGLFQGLRPLTQLELQNMHQGIHTNADTENDLSGSSKTTPGSSALVNGFANESVRGNRTIQRTRTDTASRLIKKASPQKLYWAFVDPDVLVRWLPPAGMSGRIERFEPQPGGSYRMVLTHKGTSGSFEGKSSSNTDIVEGKFVELVPGERIVQAVAFDSSDPAYAGEMKLTWKFEDAGEGTQVTVICEHVPGGIGRSEHEGALASTLANLERVVG